MTDHTLPLSKKDFASGQDVRWCPGCGDYAILSAVQSTLAEVGTHPDRTVFISGIGCSSRFPYYMNTYGMHSIHGRAPAIASGMAVARPDLDVWVVTGDGDALSIGGNHLIHTLRRNVNINILLFNNQIYGLTKGQYSPTSKVGQVTKSSPAGAIDEPFNPVSLALGAEASFVARTVDNDRAHLSGILAAAHAHPGASFIEIYQNCAVFNDDAFAPVRDRATGAASRIELIHGQPVTFGTDGDRRAVIVGSDGGLRTVPADEAGDRVLVHDAHSIDPSRAFALSRLSSTGHEPTPFGIFRQVQRPTYHERLADQMDAAARDDAVLDGLLGAGLTWQVA